MGRPVTKTRIHHKIYNYLDYRKFLKDLVRELKSNQKGFTMRSFAEKAGFGSPSYLKMVLDGQRQLTEKSLDKFSKALEITGREKDYFEILVKYTQCVDPDEKDRYFELLEKIRPRKTFSELEKNQHKFLTKDYFSCVREMVLLSDFEEDAKWIAARCQPRISPQEAREAIDCLLELNLLKRDDSGKLIQAEAVVGTKAQTEALEAYHYHETALNKARQCLGLVEPDKRNFQSLVIPANAEIVKLIHEKMERLLTEVLDEVNLEGQSYEEVYQLGLQLFPVTKKEG